MLIKISSKIECAVASEATGLIAATFIREKYFDFLLPVHLEVVYNKWKALLQAGVENYELK